VLRRADNASLSFRKKRFLRSRYVYLWAPGVRGGEVGLLTEEQCQNHFAWQEAYPQSLTPIFTQRIDPSFWCLVMRTRSVWCGRRARGRRCRVGWLGAGRVSRCAGRGGPRSGCRG
jgi:hypothetical protein